MIPMLATLGLVGSALSAIGLMKNLSNIGGKPSDQEVLDAIESKATLLSQANGVPMEQAKAAVAEQTMKDLQEQHSFQPSEALMQAIGILPGIGLAKFGKMGVDSAKAGLAAGKELGVMGSIKAASEGMGMAGWGSMVGRGPTGMASKYTPKGGAFAGPTATPTSAAQATAGKTVGEEAAEVANPGIRITHGAEEAGEYSSKYALAGDQYSTPVLNTTTIKNIPIDVPTYQRFIEGQQQIAKQNQMSKMFALRKRMPANAMQEMPSGVGEYGSSLSGQDQFMQMLKDKMSM